MSEWPSQPLGELATVTMGQSPDSAAVNGTEAGLPFLQGCAEFGERFPSPRLHCSPPLRVAKTGSTLISVRAPVGTTNRADQDYCIGRGLGAVLAKPGLADNVFLLYAIEANLEYLHRRSQGSTFVAISSKDLYSLPVPAPSLPTQRRIAEILSTLDQAIEQTEALITKMQQVKAGLMRDLFTRGVTPDGRLRPTREQAPELYKGSLLGWIPKEWEVGTLQDVVSPNRPIVYGILMPGTGVPGGVPVIKVKDIVDGEIRSDNLLLTSPEIDAEYQRSKLKTDDVLLTIRGSVGRLAMVPPELDGANITQDTARIGIVRGHSVFYRYYLETSAPRRHFALNTLGVAVQGINLRDVRTTCIPFLDITEQRLIASRINNATFLLKREFEGLEKMRKAKVGLMHDLITGKVRARMAMMEAAI